MILELGLKGDEIRVVPYDNDWHQAFLDVQQQLHEATGIPLNRIAHIGSTAIPTIEAKPIIDCMVGVDSLTLAPQFFEACKKIWHALLIRRLR